MPGTERGIQIRAEKETWRSRPRSGRGGGREYHLSSLPAQARNALLTVSVGPSSVFDQDEIKVWGASRRINLSPSQLADPSYLIKVSVARAIETCPAYSGRERLIAELASIHGVASVTIRRWHGEVMTARPSSRPRIQVGTERVEIPASRKFAPEALAYGLGCYARDLKAGLRAAYRDMTIEASARGWKIGDYSNFTRAAKKLPPSILIHIRKGNIGAELALAPKVIRQWTAVPVQSVLCGDQKIFDYVVKDTETDELIIPNGYLWMDCASRDINGAWIELGHYNGLTVGNALREALRYGIPDEIFTDWGKPELSKHTARILKGLSALSRPGDFSTMQDKFGDVPDIDDEVDHRKAQPGKPWKKPIENVMNLIEVRLRDKHLPGYRKRMKDAWENKVTQAELKGMIKGDRLMTIEDFIQTVFSAIAEHNQAEKKLKEGGKIVPQDFFFSGLQARPPQTIDDRTLDYICLPCYERTPHQSVVTLQVRPGDTRRYFAPALAGMKDRVQVSVDPYDREAPAVLTDLSGNYLDIAEAWNVHDPRDAEGLARKIERQKELMKWVREQAKRLKNNFGLVETPSVTKVTPQTYTARRAEKAKLIYERQKENARIVAADQKREADELRAELVARFEEAEASEKTTPETMEGNAVPFRPFHLPPEGRDRYIYYLQLNERVVLAPQGLAEPLTEQERNWFEYYPTSEDYKACKGLHEKHGSIYLNL
jgi:hypothetical protein